jgi:SAM-dependent methyltransferase
MTLAAKLRGAPVGDQDAFYAMFDKQGEQYFWFRGHYAIAQKLVDSFWERDGRGNVLEIGPGPGSFLARLAPYGRVFASDLVSAAARHCRSRHGVASIQADATALPFRSGSMRHVVAMEVIEHIRDDVGAMREIARVLGPGGWLLMSVPAFQLLWGEHDELAGHQRRYAKRRVVELVRASGLAPVHVTYARLAFFLPLLAMRLFKRARRRQGATPRADFLPAPGALGALLYRASVIELPLLGWASIPFGTHVFCVARRLE